MLKWPAGFLFFLVFVLPVSAQQTDPGDQVPDFDPFAVQKLEKPFEYFPLDPRFWQNLNQLIEISRKDKNAIQESLALVKDHEKIEEAIALAEDQFSDGQEDEVRAAEGRLGWAMALSEGGYKNAALFALKQVAIEQSGSSVSSYALLKMSEILQQVPYDQQVMNDFLTAKQFTGLHPEIQSFVSYHRAHHHLDKGLLEWFKEEFAKIRPGSFWHLRWKYFVALKLISRNQIDPAKERLKEILESDQASDFLKQRAKIQVARLHFENGDFEKAYEVYTTLGELDVREKGRILLEKAWTKYYLKDFSKALGLLHVLKAPFFDPSLNYERYLLEILIYRQLCHYEAVELIVADFRRRFARPLQSIRERGDLRKDKTLATIALMDPQFQDRANYVNELRKERERMLDRGFDGNLYAEILESFKMAEELVRNRIDREVEDKVRQVAISLIDAEEQITFLEYTAKLDALRIVRQGENRSYLPPKISRWTFEKIYWRIDREFWWDELDQYQSLISSRCEQLYTPVGVGNSSGDGIELDEE